MKNYIAYLIGKPLKLVWITLILLFEVLAGCYLITGVNDINPAWGFWLMLVLLIVILVVAMYQPYKEYKDGL